jgi:hypothetical protein
MLGGGRGTRSRRKGTAAACPTATQCWRSHSRGEARQGGGDWDVKEEHVAPLLLLHGGTGSLPH